MTWNHAPGSMSTSDRQPPEKPWRPVVVTMTRIAVVIGLTAVVLIVGIGMMADGDDWKNDWRSVPIGLAILFVTERLFGFKIGRRRYVPRHTD